MAGADACTIMVRVQPRSSRNRIAGYRDGALRVSVSAPPREGRANAALLDLLAGSLGIPRARLQIVRGHGSRDKVVAVEGMTAGEVAHRLEAPPG